MIFRSLSKAPNKINKRLINLNVSLAAPISKHVQKKSTLALICILTIVILGTITGNFGSIKSIAYANSVKGIGVGIYWDQACTNKTLSLNWGPVDAGSTKNLTIYVRNEANSAVSLWLSTTNWTPSACSDYMSLNWNYSGQRLKVDEVIPLELTLTVNSTITGITSFSFDTIITVTNEP